MHSEYSRAELERLARQSGLAVECISRNESSLVKIAEDLHVVRLGKATEQLAEVA